MRIQRYRETMGIHGCIQNGELASNCRELNRGRRNEGEREENERTRNLEYNENLNICNDSSNVRPNVVGKKKIRLFSDRMPGIMII